MNLWKTHRSSRIQRYQLRVIHRRNPEIHMAGSRCSCMGGIFPRDRGKPAWKNNPGIPDSRSVGKTGKNRSKYPVSLQGNPSRPDLSQPSRFMSTFHAGLSTATGFHSQRHVQKFRLPPPAGPDRGQEPDACAAPGPCRGLSTGPWRFEMACYQGFCAVFHSLLLSIITLFLPSVF